MGQSTISEHLDAHNSAVDALHLKCAVYTQSKFVIQALDAVGWNEHQDLRNATLLEPSCGDGAFVIEAARRLLNNPSLRSAKPAEFSEKILAFELFAAEAEVTREAVRQLLLSDPRFSSPQATSLANTWVRTGDFLTTKVDVSPTHVVGNPPYCRWSKVPKILRLKYESIVPPLVAKGDIFLPFLHKSLDLLKRGGRLGFVCSDRWRFMAFANGFRNHWQGKLSVETCLPLQGSEAFLRNVDAYSDLLILRRTPSDDVLGVRPAVGPTLKESGFSVRVGPALGGASAFLFNGSEAAKLDIPTAPYIDGTQIVDDGIELSGRAIAVRHIDNGKLDDLGKYPVYSQHLENHKSVLEARSVVTKQGVPWHAPIDKIRAEDWAAPKILVPELAKTPRCCLDFSGAIPSHGVYAIFHENENSLRELYDRWREGGLAQALDGRAPKVKGGYVRCYKRFLEALPASGSDIATAQSSRD